ncbi:MAG: hypothetical protein IJG53_06200 [Eggerthellaceae bacterium]|nr:hypothetical protein [Eggerthellaceae bacterium]
MVLTGEDFLVDGQMAVRDAGCPTCRVMEIKGYFWHQDPELKVPLANEWFDRIIAEFTRPLTAEELNPEPLKREPFPDDIIGPCDSYADAVEAYNEYLCGQHWTTGAYLVPPTREKVDWMLSGISRDPQDVIGTKPGAETVDGVVTVEKVAINSVMVGAKPEYLPVIVAAMECLQDEEYDSLHMSASAGSFDTIICVGGAISQEIGMNQKTGIWGYGYRANSTIGQAVRLTTINLGHLWPGENDMAANGRDSIISFKTFSENYEFSPWAPYHTADVAGGYPATASSVTCSTVSPGTGSFAGNNAKDIMKSILTTCKNKGFNTIRAYQRGQAMPNAHPQKTILVIYPGKAGLIKDEFGFKSIQEFIDYVYDNTKIDASELTEDDFKKIQDRVENSDAAGSIYADILPTTGAREEWRNVYQTKSGVIHSFIEKRDFVVLVCGSSEGYGNAVSFSYMRAPYNWCSLKTKQIKGATLTQNGK